MANRQVGILRKRSTEHTSDSSDTVSNQHHTKALIYKQLFDSVGSSASDTERVTDNQQPSTSGLTINNLPCNPLSNSDIYSSDSSSDFVLEDEIPLAILQKRKRWSSAEGSRKRVCKSNNKEDMSTWTDVQHAEDLDNLPEFTETEGLQIDVEGFNPVDYFASIFDDEILDLIVKETNRYANEMISGGLKPQARLHSWEPVTRGELQIFFALQIMMGIKKLPEISDYWSTHWIFNSDTFRQIMTSKRYSQLNMTFHFVNNADKKEKGELGYDPCFKVRPIIDHLRHRFQAIYYPSRELSVDESMCAFKGRLSFKQYIPMKHHRFGIKD